MSLPGYDIESMTKRATASIDRFLIGIKRHLKSSPIKSKKIEKALGLSGIEVRAIVSYLRIKSYPIASGGKGYFWATSPEELDITIEHIKSRIARMQYVINGLEIAKNNLRIGVHPEKAQEEIFK